ncbi:DUF1697 domain-containing protein [Stieleria sp. JC731]|uniref:DUF1697 domain-containing protein n=1 Tax=Pirellulaceae TaxID=2691357 RepID=UPI001E2E9908|nr:DUF1697 domain-containing protein [Stieleria sp. JC731]MCC9599107.1 DUF1697 domain-containing protein [Stieleria sp. JC731]
MQTWIALFRGINVGGNNILPMAKLRENLESLQLRNVQTYIQSGNAVFESKAKTSGPLTKKIQQAIESEHGFRPNLILLSSEQFEETIEANPFPDASDDPKSLHFFFLQTPATDADLPAIDAIKSETEQYVLTDSVFYLHAPEGIGRSKLAAKVERYLDVPTTARNFRTVQKLSEMVGT